MNLVPDSIKSNQTLGFDQTLEQRLKLINLNEIMIDFENETNADKLQLFLEMFSIDGNMFDFLSLNATDRHQLFLDLLEVMRLSGTQDSIKKIATILGATDCLIENNHFRLRHDGQARHNGYHNHDPDAYQKFAIKILITGIPLFHRVAFEALFRKLMNTLIPIRLYIMSINYL